MEKLNLNTSTPQHLNTSTPQHLNTSTAITEIVPLKEAGVSVAESETSKLGTHSIQSVDLKDKRVLNVAFLYRRMYNGGIERVHQILTTELSKRYGYNVYCVAKEEAASDYPLGHDVHKIIISDPWDKNIPVFQEKEHIDVVVNSGYGLLSLECIKKLQDNLCKVVSIYHGWCYWMIFANVTAKNFDIQKSLIRSDVLCVLSKVDAKLRQLAGIKQTMYMPNPLTFDLDKITPSPLTSKNILLVGRINAVKTKRPKLAIQAFAEIIKNVPDAKLQMVGACPDNVKKELLQEAKRLNVPEGSIEFPGFTLDVDKYYKNASVFLMPSLFEGFPMALSEAKAYGLPNIVTKMGYLETTKKGTIVVGKDDVAGIAREAIKLLTDDEYRHQQGKLARESLEEFRNKYVIDKWEQLLHAVVEWKESTQEFIDQQPTVDEEYALRIAREEYDATKPYNDYTRTHPFTLFPLSEEEKIRRELREMETQKKRDIESKKKVAQVKTKGTKSAKVNAGNVKSKAKAFQLSTPNATKTQPKSEAKNTQPDKKKAELIKKDNVNPFALRMMQRMKKKK